MPVIFTRVYEGVLPTLAPFFVLACLVGIAIDLRRKSPVSGKVLCAIAILSLSWACSNWPGLPVLSSVTLPTAVALTGVSLDVWNAASLKPGPRPRRMIFLLPFLQFLLVNVYGDVKNYRSRRQALTLDSTNLRVTDANGPHHISRAKLRIVPVAKSFEWREWRLKDGTMDVGLFEDDLYRDQDGHLMHGGAVAAELTKWKSRSPSAEGQ